MDLAAGRPAAKSGVSRQAAQAEAQAAQGRRTAQGMRLPAHASSATAHQPAAPHATHNSSHSSRNIIIISSSSSALTAACARVPPRPFRTPQNATTHQGIPKLTAACVRVPVQPQTNRNMPQHTGSTQSSLPHTCGHHSTPCHDTQGTPTLTGACVRAQHRCSLARRHGRQLN